MAEDNEKMIVRSDLGQKSADSLASRRLFDFKLRGGKFDKVLLSSAILIIVLMTWLMLGKIRESIRSELESTLGTILHSTSEAAQNYISQRVTYAKIRAASPRLRNLVKRQLELPRSREVLIADSALAQIRSFFQSSFQNQGFQGFFIISPDSIIIASMRDSNVGLAIHPAFEGDFLSGVFEGASRFTLPVLADAALLEVTDKFPENQLFSLIGVPVLSEKDSVIAVLILCDDPTHDFTNIIQFSRLGNTGETYAFDRKGRLITEIRHIIILYQLGLLKKNERSVISVEIRDPGGDLAEGHKPALPRNEQPLTHMASQAVAGKSGIDLEGYRNYRGVPVVGAWMWDERFGFGIATEIEYTEAYRPFNEIRLIVLAVLGVTIIMFVSLSVMLSNSRKKAVALAEQATTTTTQLQHEMEVRWQVEKILRDNDEYIRAVVNAVLDSIITTDNHGTIETFNPTAENMFGYKTFEIIGENLKKLFPEPFQSEIENQINLYRKSGKSKLVGTSREIFGKRKDGSTFPLELSLSVMNLGDSKKFVAIAKDITKHKRFEDKLRLLSSQDGLTGITNRRTFDMTIEVEWKRAIRSSLPLSLIMIDIDFFKNYNDSLGHQAGDECLKKIAASIKKSLKRPGDLAARYGGEEFVVLLPGTTLSGAVQLAQYLRTDIEKLKIAHPDSKISDVITISLGVSSVVPSQDSKPGQLIAQADKALYKAKREGRNRVLVSD